MDNSIYIALSGQTNQFRHLEITAQNVANANTAGYQAEKLMFTDYLVEMDTGYSGSAASASYSHNESSYRVTKPGRLEYTDNPLDVAITGGGYFGIETPDGIRYTRAGNFNLNNRGELVTAQGYPVVSREGGAITFEPTDTNILVGDNGMVTALGLDKSSPREERGTIAMFEFDNEQNMFRVGENLYETEEPALQAQSSRMVQGALEQSNVSSVSELVTLTNLQRATNKTAKLIEVAYDLQRKTSNTYTQNQ